MAGDLNVNSWGAEYANWVEEHDLWILAGPYRLTYRTGAVDDAILKAVGAYLPEGILPSEADTAKGTESAERYSVYVTKDPFIGEHMALTIGLTMQRPDMGIERWSYNIR